MSKDYTSVQRYFFLRFTLRSLAIVNMLSGGATHLSMARIEKPLDFDELEEIYKPLVQL